MATWNSSDVVLTLKGREILSKVQSGNGSITVSRIMTGAGYVPPAQLFSQTAVTDERQEARIVKVDTTVGGSSVEVQIDNLDLTEPYDLYQLGIYVTHKDYDEEVLYLIAQCDINNPDRIPLASDTPITVHYSLFMEHSNTDNVEINVNLSDLVYRSDFEALKEKVDKELMPKTGGTFTGEVNMSSQNRFMLGGKFYIRYNSAQNALEIGVLP